MVCAVLMNLYDSINHASLNPGMKQSLSKSPARKLVKCSAKVYRECNPAYAVRPFVTLTPRMHTNAGVLQGGAHLATVAHSATDGLIQCFPWGVGILRVSVQ